MSIVDLDDPEFKLGRNQGGRGGTTPGGGGGFASFTGGGGGFFGGLSGGGSWGANAARNPLQRRPRMSMMGGMEVNNVSPSDTVPAWLTPGEFVMNDQSARMFGPELERMNNAGNAMRYGQAMVPDEMYSGAPVQMDMGGPVPFRVEHGYNMGGPVNPFGDAEGYSLGGWLKKNLTLKNYGKYIALNAAIAAAALGAGAMGGGAAGAAGASGAGASGAGAGAAGAGTLVSSGPAAGLSYGPMAAVPATQNVGYGASFLGQHPGVAGALRSGKAAAPYLEAAYNLHNRRKEDREQAAREALEFYLASRRQSSARGYAFGGQVSPWGGGGRMNRNPWGGGQASPVGGGGARRPPAWGTPPPAPSAQDPFTSPGYTAFRRGGLSYDPQGNVGTFDPRNPWAHRTQNLVPNSIGDLVRQVGKYGEQGYFDPGGNPRVRQAVREQAMNDARAFGDQAYLSADVGGMDPAAAAAFRTQALSNAGRGVADQMTRYAAEQALADQAYGRDQFGRIIGIDSDSVARNEDYRNAARLKP